MMTLLSKCRQLLRCEEGPTTVEYAVMLALIILVCFSAIAAIGNPTSSSFGRVVTQGGFGGGS